jgi:CheY-like chemotaxis protein
MATQAGPILIVEDIPYLLEMVEVTLKAKGYEVLTAHNGEEALQLIEKQAPALVLTDILMPKLDGFNLAHKIRSNPKTKDIPIVFISATYISPEDKAFAHNLGAVKFLEKPIDADELLLTVGETLSKGLKAKTEPITNQAFYRGYQQRLEAKLKHKDEQIERARRLVATVTEEQRPMFEALLVQTEVQRDQIEVELKLLENLLEDQAS